MTCWRAVLFILRAGYALESDTVRRVYRLTTNAEPQNATTWLGLF